MQINLDEILDNLFQVNVLMRSKIGLLKEQHILAPITIHERIVGILLLLYTSLADYSILYVRNLVQHFSNTLHLADQHYEIMKISEKQTIF